MNIKFRRILILVLALMLVVSQVPFGARAADSKAADAGFQSEQSGQDPTVQAVAQIQRGEEVLSFDTLEEAIAQAEDSEEIYLFDAVTITETIVIDKSLVIRNGDYGAVTSTCDVAFRLERTGDESSVRFQGIQLDCAAEDGVLFAVTDTNIQLHLFVCDITLSGGGRPAVVTTDYDGEGCSTVLFDSDRTHLGSGFGIKAAAPTRVSISEDGMQASLEEEIETNYTYYMTGYCPVYLMPGSEGSEVSVGSAVYGRALETDTAPWGAVVVEADDVKLYIADIIVSSAGSAYSALKLNQKLVSVELYGRLAVEEGAVNATELSGLCTGQYFTLLGDCEAEMRPLLEVDGFVLQEDGMLFRESDFAARIGDTYYTTLEEAMEAAAEFEEIVLLQDVDLTGTGQYFEITKPMRFASENGVTITSDHELIFDVVNGDWFGLRGIHVVSNAAGAVCFRHAHNEGENGIELYDSTVTMNGDQSVMALLEGESGSATFVIMHGAAVDVGAAGTMVVQNAPLDAWAGVVIADVDSGVFGEFAGIGTTTIRCGTCVENRSGAGVDVALGYAVLDVEDTVIKANEFPCSLNAMSTMELTLNENGRVISGLSEEDWFWFEFEHCDEVECDEEFFNRFIADVESEGFYYNWEGYLLRDCEAKMGWYGFATLQDALDGIPASSNGAHIQILRDITVNTGGEYAYAITRPVHFYAEEPVTITSDCATVFNVDLEVDNWLDVTFYNVNIVNTAENGCCAAVLSDMVNLKFDTCQLTATNGETRVISVADEDSFGVYVILLATVLDAGENGTGVYAASKIALFVGCEPLPMALTMDSGIQPMSEEERDLTSYIYARTCVDIQPTAAESGVMLSAAHLEATDTAIALNEAPVTVSVAEETVVEAPAAAFSGVTAGQTIVVDENNETVTEQLEDALEDTDLVVDEEGNLVVKEEGAVRNTSTGTTYDTVAEALADAQAGETVQLLADCEENRVLVTPGITLDLNGHTLTAGYVVGFNTSAICDSTNNEANGYIAQGLLAVDLDNMVLYEGNGAVPVYNPEKGGYIFVDFLFNSAVEVSDELVTVNMLVTSRTMEVIGLLKDGAMDNDIQIAVRLSWDNETGTAYQDFVFNETTIQNVMQSNKDTPTGFGRMFYVNVSGLENLSGVTATPMVIAGSNAVDSGRILNVN